MAFLYSNILSAQYDSINDTFFCDDIYLKKNLTEEIFAFTCDNPDIVFTPSSTDEVEDIINVAFDGTGYADGTYIVNGTAVSASETLTFTINIEVGAAVVPPPPPPPPPTVPKYWLEYTNLQSDVFKLEIWEQGFEGETTEIHGTVKHNYTERRDLLDAIIPSSLDITLEADQGLTLTDLYSENERNFTVKFYRNTSLIFHGYLKPDGIWEDYVTDRWEISLDAMDGLSILKDLYFVTDTGGAFTGLRPQYEVVYYALRRIGYELPINVSMDLPVYDGMPAGECVLHSVITNCERFMQDDDNKTFMDCESVLKSVLEPYNATIIQMNGEWFIFRAVDVKASMTFKRHIGFDVGTEVTINGTVILGSEIDEYPIHHANANQKKSIDASLQAFRVNYKYGVVRTITDNSELKTDGAGLDMVGWLAHSNAGKVVRQEDGTGIKVISNPGSATLIETNQTIEVEAEDRLDLIINYTKPYFGGGASVHKVKYRITTANYILGENGWNPIGTYPTLTVPYLFNRADYDVTHVINIPSILENSSLNVTVYSETLNPVSDNFGMDFRINSIEVKPSKDSNYKGEFHTAQRLTRVSTVTKNDKVVHNGDSESDIYVGTLYKTNGDATTVWNRIGVTEELPLLHIMVADALRMRPRPMIYFEGDIHGYYNYLSFFSINNIPGKFQVSKYSYNTATNINKSALKEFETDFLIEGEDYRYEQTTDYGNMTNVKIVS